MERFVKRKTVLNKFLDIFLIAESVRLFVCSFLLRPTVSKRMSSRAIKQELLDNYYPEVYVEPAAGSRRRAVKRERKPKVEAGYVKLEPGVDLKKIDVKSLTRKIKTKKKGKRSSADYYGDDLEFVGATAPRRPYQWKGRKVQRFLRPGAVVSFTPGQRSGTRAKRSYDEVMADEDLLLDMERGEGEFRYGKRGRYEPLDSSNPTPSLKPVTEQYPVALPGQAFLLPTVQVMAPRKRRYVDDPLEAFDSKRIKNEDVKPLVQIEDIKVRARKRAAPGIDIETIDVKIPMEETPSVKPRKIAVARKRKAAVDVKLEPEPVEPMTVEPTPAETVAVRPTYGPANKIMPAYRKHPSMLLVPPVSALPKVKRRRRSRRRAPSVGANIIPRVVYHPSIKMPGARRARTIRV